MTMADPWQTPGLAGPQGSRRGRSHLVDAGPSKADRADPDPSRQTSATGRLPRGQCCLHPERHAGADPYGWWRHDLPDDVAAMIRRAVQRGASWRRVAEACGISPLYLWQLAKGLRAPAIGKVDRIADGLHLDDDERELLAEYAVRDLDRHDEAER